VEGVGVRADRRGRGHGAAMTDTLETVVRGAYEPGALGAADEAAAFYAARGWMLRRGPSSALTPSGIRRTGEDDGCIYVPPIQVPLDLSSQLTCDWRDGDLWQSRPLGRPGPPVQLWPRTGPVGRNDGGACGNTVPGRPRRERFPSQDPPDRRGCVWYLAGANRVA
jgi:hypothetical protein